MRNFLYDLLFTFLLCLSLIVVMEIAIGKTQTSYSYKAWYMTQHSDKIKILILGNSLLENSFNPHILGDSVFDGASSGRSQYYDVGIMKKYTLHMSNLETIIISLHPCLYVDPLPLKRHYPYAIYMGIPSGNNPIQYSALFSGRFTLTDLKSTPVSALVLEKKDDFNQDVDSLGYSPRFSIWDGHTITVPIETLEEVLPKQPLFVDQVIEMARFCDSMGFRLIYILPPASNCYLKRIDHRLYKMLDSSMSNLCGFLNIEYRFYHQDPNFRSDSLYADELHLNHIGATLFAQRVKWDFDL